MRDDLPTGTVTFLFTDVEGSTKLLHSLGAEGYAEALAEHRRIIREACAAEGGVEVDTQGDAFFFAFPTAPGALAAASAFTDALASGQVQVRVGLHTGTPLPADEGYVGDDVHRAARIAGCGHGGQVLVSAASAQLVERELRERSSRSTSCALAAETSTWPPWPQPAMRAARWTSSPTYPSSAGSGVPVCRPTGPAPPRCKRSAKAMRRQRSRRGREREEEGVTLRIDLDATFSGARLPDDAAVLGERLGVALGAERVQELRRALDVGEKESDSAGRKVVAIRRHHPPVANWRPVATSVPAR